MSKEISFSVGALFINALLISLNVSLSFLLQNTIFSIAFSIILSLCTLAINTKKYAVIKNTNDFSFYRVVMIDSLGAVFAHFSVWILLENLWAALLMFFFIMMFTLLTGKTNKLIPSDEQKISVVESFIEIYLPHDVKVLQYYNNRFEILAKCQFDFESFKALYKNRIINISSNNRIRPKSIIGQWDLNSIPETLNDYVVTTNDVNNQENLDGLEQLPRILVELNQTIVYLYFNKQNTGIFT